MVNHLPTFLKSPWGTLAMHGLVKTHCVQTVPTGYVYHNIIKTKRHAFSWAEICIVYLILGYRQYWVYCWYSLNTWVLADSLSQHSEDFLCDWSASLGQSLSHSRNHNGTWLIVPLNGGGEFYLPYLFLGTLWFPSSIVSLMLPPCNIIRKGMLGCVRNSLSNLFGCRLQAALGLLLVPLKSLAVIAKWVCLH